VVGGDAIHLTCLLGHAAEEISAANYDSDLDAKRMNVGQLGSDFVNAQGIHAETLVCRQSLAGQFEQNALEHRSWHGFLVSSFQFLVSGWMLHGIARLEVLSTDADGNWKTRD